MLSARNFFSTNRDDGQVVLHTNSQSGNSGSLTQYITACESANHPSEQNPNPLNLILPRELNGPRELFHTHDAFLVGSDFQFCEDGNTKEAEGKEKRNNAQIAFIKLMKNINGAFIIFLKSISDGDISGNKLRDALSGGYDKRELFRSTGIRGNAFSRDMQKIIDYFPIAIATYFMLQLVFSDNSYCTTENKVNGIKLVLNAYSRDTILAAFGHFNDGYRLGYDKDSRELIPRQFVATAEEMNSNKQKKCF